MKLGQRLLIRYYKTKFRTLALVSPRKAAEAAIDLFCMPFDNKLPRKAPPAFREAERLSFETAGHTIRGFRFAPASPNGKKILVVHGFRSYSYKFESYLLAFRRQGFEVFAFDAPGHGLSDGKRINAYIYKEVLDRAEALYGPFYGVMGHSLGGLAASLFFEGLPDKQHRRLALVAPAETATAIENFFRILDIDEKVRGVFTELVEEMTGRPVAYFSVGRAVTAVSAPVLWVHDEHDLVCPFDDVKPVLEQRPAHVNFHITRQLGHSKVYKTDSVQQEIMRFFREGIS